MSRGMLGVRVGIVLGIMAACFAVAAPFEPAFKIKRISGTCQVMLPDAKDYTDAEDGKAYPYGTRLKTGRRSSAVIEFSDGNTCRVLAGAFLTVTEDAKDQKLKSIKLEEGKIEVALEEGFHQNNSFNVETATAICGAIGCKFSVDHRKEPNMTVTVYITEEGKIRVFSPNLYEIRELDKDDILTVSSSADQTFTRLTSVQGSFTVTFVDDDGNAKEVELQKDATVKIWTKLNDAGDEIIVTILVTNPDGTLKEAITMTHKVKKGQAVPPTIPTPPTPPAPLTPIQLRELEKGVQAPAPDRPPRNDRFENRNRPNPVGVVEPIVRPPPPPTPPRPVLPRLVAETGVRREESMTPTGKR